MKKASYLFALLITLGSFAQKNTPKRINYTTEQKTQLKVKTMSIDLDLNSKQIEAITPIIRMRFANVDAARAANKGKKKTKKTLTTNESFDATMKRLNDRAIMYDKMKAILNPQQFIEWKIMHRELMARTNQKKKKIAQDLKRKQNKALAN